MLNFFQKFDTEKDKYVTLSIVSGFIILMVALWMFGSSVSYLFTWDADQSILGDTVTQMLNNTEAKNVCGTSGSKIGHVLVGNSFGLASFVLIYGICILGIRLLRIKFKPSYRKIILVTVLSCFLLSWLFAFISKIFSLETVFGGGLGGNLGAMMVFHLSNFLGNIIAFVFILLGLLLTGILSSEKINGKVMEFLQQRKFSDFVKTKKKNVGKDNEESVPESVESVKKIYEKEPEKTFEDIRDADTADDDTLEVEKEIIPEREEEHIREENLPDFNIREELNRYEFPGIDLLEDYPEMKRDVSREELNNNNRKIQSALNEYKIAVKKVSAVVGPTVTLYKVYPAEGVKISSILNRHDDMAMRLNVKGVRMTKLTDSVGIEVPNNNPSLVPLKSILDDDAFKNSAYELPIAIGYTITQNVKVFNLTDSPHLLIAGATKQGKSVGLNVLISSLLYSKHPSELKFVFIDPKKVEFTQYSKLLKHYLAVLPNAAGEEDEKNKSIAKDAKQAEEILRSLCIEMDERYDLLSKALVTDMKAYNVKYAKRYLLPEDGHKFLPYIVTVIDEYADLTMSVGSTGEAKAMARSINDSIIRLAQKGRAAGIHVVLATQRPSVDVITGLIKANFPTRIAFRVLSGVDSRTILDSPGAEKLVGKGDMLYFDGIDRERVQCAYVSTSEIGRITSHIENQSGYKKSYNTPYYLPMCDEQGESVSGMVDMNNLDDRFEEAAILIVQNQRGSTSDLQRRLGMGYAKAGRVMDQLEAAGIVGPQEGSKPRQVLVSSLEELRPILNAFLKRN